MTRLLGLRSTQPAASAAAVLTVAALAFGSAPAVAATGTTARAAADQTLQTRWVGAEELATGKIRGAKRTARAVRLAKPTRTTRVSDPFGNAPKQTYDRGTWTSRWTSTGFPATNLVPSWNAIARKGALVRIDIRVASGGTVGSWDRVATWGSAPTGVRRHSGATSADDLARLSTDTVLANPGRSFDRWQIKVTLLRPQGTKIKPRLFSVGATVANYTTTSRPVSATRMKQDVTLDVPTYSQMVHSGHHPEWGGGGEAWCSPTSMAMVMGFHGVTPKAADLAWERGVDPVVDHAARQTYDHRYRGTGNWSFNAAFAGDYRLDAFVTRLRDLRDVEKMIHKGIPVVTSIRFGRGQLTGAPISSTNGHLLVVVGFTASGQVVVNDPAGATNNAVRRTYDRAQFERAWLGGSGGVSYVVRPSGTPLPNGNARW